MHRACVSMDRRLRLAHDIETRHSGRDCTQCETHRKVISNCPRTAWSLGTLRCRCDLAIHRAIRDCWAPGDSLGSLQEHPPSHPASYAFPVSFPISSCTMKTTKTTVFVAAALVGQAAAVCPGFNYAIGNQQYLGSGISRCRRSCHYYTAQSYVSCRERVRRQLQPGRWSHDHRKSVQ
jgi:hypothetical protein